MCKRKTILIGSGYASRWGVLIPGSYSPQAKSAQDTAGDYTQAAKGKASDLTGSTKDNTGKTQDKAGDYAQVAKDKASSAADTAGDKVICRAQYTQGPPFWYFQDQGRGRKCIRHSLRLCCGFSTGSVSSKKLFNATAEGCLHPTN